MKFIGSIPLIVERNCWREKSFFFDGELSQEHNGWGDLLCVRYNWPNLRVLKMKKAAVAAATKGSYNLSVL
jgi:hypothetical protein